MYSFTNITTKEKYERAKREQGISFEYIPNTAVGMEDIRKYVNMNGFKYFLQANTEKSYCLHMKDEVENLFINFKVDGDRITIEEAHYNKRRERADKYLKKYVNLLCAIHSILKYDKIITYTDMYGNRWLNGVRCVA